MWLPCNIAIVLLANEVSVILVPEINCKPKNRKCLMTVVDGHLCTSRWVLTHSLHNFRCNVVFVLQEIISFYWHQRKFQSTLTQVQWLLCYENFLNWVKTLRVLTDMLFSFSFLFCDFASFSSTSNFWV